MIHEKLFKKLESLINTEEGRKLAKRRADSETLQRIESLINELSELIVDDHIEHMISTATEMMTEMYEGMITIFGRGDTEMRNINKLIRDLITI